MPGPEYREPEYKKWLTEDGLLLVQCWKRDGLTDVQIAERMGISESYLRKMRREHPEFNEAIQRGREVIDYQVENALLKLALGFETKEIKTIVNGLPDKNGNRRVRMETTVKNYVPNVTAIAMWLNNRKPDQWKRNRDNVLELNDEDSGITVNVVRHGGSKDKQQTTNDDDTWDVGTETNNSTTKSSNAKSSNNGSKKSVPKTGKADSRSDREKKKSAQEMPDDADWPEDFKE